MMTMLTRFVVATAVLLFTTLNAYSFNRAGDVTFSLGEGYEFFAQKRNLSNTSLPNIALAYNFNEHWGIEGMIGRILTQSKSAGHEDIRGYLYTIDGIYRTQPYYNFFQPYVIAGIGATSLKPSGTNAVSQGNINAGIGSQFFADEVVALRLELRDVYTMSGGKNDFLLNASVGFLIGT